MSDRSRAATAKAEKHNASVARRQRDKKDLRNAVSEMKADEAANAEEAAIEATNEASYDKDFED